MNTEKAHEVAVKHVMEQNPDLEEKLREIITNDWKYSAMKRKTMEQDIQHRKMWDLRMNIMVFMETARTILVAVAIILWARL